jgi:hypothetical protein
MTASECWSHGVGLDSKSASLAQMNPSVGLLARGWRHGAEGF